MAVLLKHGGKFYEIPEEVLAASTIPKERFEQKLRDLEVEIKKNGPGPSRHEFLDLSDAEDE